MVAKVRLRVPIGIMALLATAIVVVILATHITIDYSEPYTRMVSRALGAYYNIHGTYPPTLLELEPIINGNVGIECTIERKLDEQYLIAIRSASNGVHVVSVVYAVDVDGSLENYDARLLDAVPDR